jgi:hypothetical protein
VLLPFASTIFYGFFEARAEIQKCFRCFLVQMKTLKFAFEIYLTNQSFIIILSIVLLVVRVEIDSITAKPYILPKSLLQ